MHEVQKNNNNEKKQQTASAKWSSSSIFVRSLSASSKASISPFADSEFIYYGEKEHVKLKKYLQLNQILGKI